MVLRLRTVAGDELEVLRTDDGALLEGLRARIAGQVAWLGVRIAQRAGLPVAEPAVLEGHRRAPNSEMSSSQTPRFWTAQSVA